MKIFTCPVHGDQGGFVGVMVDLTGSHQLPVSLRDKAQRKYCMACWIEMMDRELEPLSERDPVEEAEAALRKIY